MPLGSALNSLLLLAKNLDSTKSTIYTGKKGKPDKPVVFDRNEKINHLEEKIDKKRKRPRGIIEKESKN